MLLRERGPLSMVPFSTSEALFTEYNDLMCGSVEKSKQLVHKIRRASVHAEQLAFVSINDIILLLQSQR